MDSDALRYTGFVTSPFQGNVQFDRHPSDVGGCFFGAKGVQSTLTEDAVEDARGAASAVWGVVWDGCDWRFVLYVGRFWMVEIGYVRITRTVRETYVAAKCSEGTITRTETEV